MDPYITHRQKTIRKLEFGDECLTKSMTSEQKTYKILRNGRTSQVLALDSVKKRKKIVRKSENPFSQSYYELLDNSISNNTVDVFGDTPKHKKQKCRDLTDVRTSDTKKQLSPTKCSPVLKKNKIQCINEKSPSTSSKVSKHRNENLGCTPTLRKLNSENEDINVSKDLLHGSPSFIPESPEVRYSNLCDRGRSFSKANIEKDCAPISVETSLTTQLSNSPSIIPCTINCNRGKSSKKAPKVKHVEVIDLVSLTENVSPTKSEAKRPPAYCRIDSQNKITTKGEENIENYFIDSSPQTPRMKRSKQARYLKHTEIIEVFLTQDEPLRDKTNIMIENGKREDLKFENDKLADGGGVNLQHTLNEISCLEDESSSGIHSPRKKTVWSGDKNSESPEDRPPNYQGVRPNKGTLCIEDFAAERCNLAPASYLEEIKKLEEMIAKIEEKEKVETNEVANHFHFATPMTVHEELHLAKLIRKPVKRKTNEWEMQLIMNNLASDRRLRLYEREKDGGEIDSPQDFCVLQVCADFPFRCLGLDGNYDEVLILIDERLVRNRERIRPGCRLRFQPPWETLKSPSGRKTCFFMGTCHVTHGEIPNLPPPATMSVAVQQFKDSALNFVDALLGKFSQPKELDVSSLFSTD